MDTFEIISEITDIETIAVETSIGEISRLRKQYGHGRWGKLKSVAMIRLRSGRVRKAELHWYEAHGIGRKESNARAIWNNGSEDINMSTPRFAICIDNSHYPASLELHKVYRVIPDENAQEDGDLRIIDESGEDYPYSCIKKVGKK
jgi:hypothetical protein